MGWCWGLMGKVRKEEGRGGGGGGYGGCGAAVAVQFDGGVKNKQTLRQQ